MTKTIRVFKRTYSSNQDISILICLVIFLIIIINLLIKKIYLEVTGFSLLFILFLLVYIRLPSKICISSDGIKKRTILLKWEEIKQIVFTVDRGSQIIDIKTKNKKPKFLIFSTYYHNSKEMRTMLEEICQEKNIDYVVKDKGSYLSKR